jgi:hypothetical protein
MMKNKPNTELFLPCELFNSLMSALDYFIGSESEIGETVSSKQATRLKTKILTHARAFEYEGDAHASIYFYGVEPAVIMKLLTIYINRGEEILPNNYYAGLKKRRSQKGCGNPTSAEQN